MYLQKPIFVNKYCLRYLFDNYVSFITDLIFLTCTHSNPFFEPTSVKFHAQH